jgi:hypothetical protein
MKRYTATILRGAAAASVVIGLAGFVSPANAEPRPQTGRGVTFANAVPGRAPSDIGNRARYVDERGQVINLARSEAPGGGAVTPKSSCQPISLPDNPHYSSPDVSGHGQWEKGNCTSSTAHVWNCVYEYYTDGTWRRKGCSAKVQLKPKSVSNNRTTARRACNSTGQLISWRNHVDVDVDGQSDPPDEPYRQADVACVVTGADQ